MEEFGNFPQIYLNSIGDMLDIGQLNLNRLLIQRVPIDSSDYVQEMWKKNLENMENLPLICL